jgi:hypothetical protein
MQLRDDTMFAVENLRDRVRLHQARHGHPEVDVRGHGPEAV